MVNAPKKQLPSWWKDGVSIYQARLHDLHVGLAFQLMGMHANARRCIRLRSRTTMATVSETCAASFPSSLTSSHSASKQSGSVPITRVLASTRATISPVRSLPEMTPARAHLTSPFDISRLLRHSRALRHSRGVVRSVRRLWGRITLTRVLLHSQELIDSAHAHGLKIMFDLVVNHCSDQHAWFKESRKDKTNPKRDWFYWKPAKYDANGGVFSRDPRSGESVWRRSRH